MLSRIRPYEFSSAKQAIRVADSLDLFPHALP